MDVQGVKKNVTLGMLRQALEEAAVGLDIPTDALDQLVERAWEKLTDIKSPVD